MSQYLISPVICTYKNHDTLKNSIQSLINQEMSPDNYEIIIVDNDLTDKTNNIIQPFIEKYNKHTIKHVKEKNLGLSFSRNSGIKAAESEIVAFIDGDAIADSQWLNSLLSVYNREHDAWAVGGKILPIWNILMIFLLLKIKVDKQ